MKAEKSAKRGRGRPSIFKKEYVAQAKKLCLLGATDPDLADFFEVSIRTIERWQSDNEEFRRAVKSGKDPADDRVERSLYQRAMGYSFDAEKIFCHQGAVTKVAYREHVAPDTTACIFWLKNRRKAEWRDRLDHEHSGNLNITHEQALAQLK